MRTWELDGFGGLGFRGLGFRCTSMLVGSFPLLGMLASFYHCLLLPGVAGAKYGGCPESRCRGPPT